MIPQWRHDPSGSCRSGPPSRLLDFRLPASPPAAGFTDHLAPRQQRLKRRAAEPPPRPADFIRHAGDGERNEIIDPVDAGVSVHGRDPQARQSGQRHSFRIASTCLGAKDPTAERTTLQMTLDAAGLLALRDLVDAEVKA